jgi:hypothetical protein
LCEMVVSPSRLSADDMVDVLNMRLMWCVSLSTWNSNLVSPFVFIVFKESTQFNVRAKSNLCFMQYVVEMPLPVWNSSIPYGCDKDSHLGLLTLNLPQMVLYHNKSFKVEPMLPFPYVTTLSLVAE